MLRTCTVLYAGLVMRRRSVGWVSIWTWPVQVESYKQKLCRALLYAENCLTGQIKQSALSVIYLCMCLDQPNCRPIFSLSLPSSPVPPPPFFFHSRFLSFVDHLVYSENPWIPASPVNKFHSLIRLACVQSKQCCSNSFLIKTVFPPC